jgi:predicted nucleic acid-binding protein
MRAVIDTNVLASGIFTDDKFITTAISGKATRIISGDKHTTK